MKKRKRLIILCTILASIVLIVILSSTVFSLSSVGVEYRTTTVYLNQLSVNDMISAGQFKVGKNIFFVDFNESADKIEKQYPYAKVINIERKFPNSAIVNIAERVPVVKVYKNTLDCLVIDNELKVLNIVSGESGYITETGENLIPKFYVDEDYNFEINTDYDKGDFIDNETLRTYVDAFYKGIYAYECTGMSIIESIKLGFEDTLNCVIFDIKFRNSTVEACIKSDYELQDVVYKVTATYLLKGDIYQTIYSTTDGIVYGVKK